MLITNANLVTWENPNRILNDHALLVVDGKIQEIGTSRDLTSKYPIEIRMDAGGKFVMPGNICAHTHFYGAFSRGMATPGPAPANFPEKLEKLWWPLDRSLDSEAVYYSAMVCLVNAVRHGTTTLFDHHASPNAIEGSLDQIAKAVMESGVRGSLCYEVTDRNGTAGALQGVAENARFIKRVQGDNQNGRLAASFGLHASLTLEESTLEACRRQAPDGSGFHIHVAEDPVDEYDSLQKTGLRVVERLSKHGILGQNSIIVHAVHIDMVEADLLAQTNTWVTHQPRSNMNNAVGLPQVEAMLRKGIKVCLGNDGFSNAMWEEWKMAFLAHKLYQRDPRRLSAETVVQMAVYNNAELASKSFHRKIGMIVPGAEADLIFVEYHPFTPVTPDNLPWHMIFGFHESQITTTIVAGKVLMDNRRLIELDEEKIASEAMRLIPGVWQRFQQNIS